MWRLLPILGLVLLAPAPALAEIAGKRPYVVDGDSFELLGVRVRLFGVDAPYPDQTCQLNGAPWNCGLDARWALSDRIGLNWVVCVERGRDPDGSVSALCYLGGIGGPDLNGWIVARGWALARRQESPAYVAQEEAARQAGRGLWRSRFVPPREWRQQ